MSNSLFSQLMEDTVPDAFLSTTRQQFSPGDRCMIELLPNEVLHSVLNKLPLTDLKAFRLTSRKFTKVPIEHIFGHIRITIHPRSIFSMRNIVADHELRQCVRMLTFDFRMLPNEVVPLRFWSRYCERAGERFCPDWGGIGSANYGSYVEYVKCQREVRGLGIQTLCSLFENLTNIRHLEVTGGTDHGAVIPTTQDYLDFKNTWPKLGIAPYRRGNKNAEYYIRRVLTATLNNSNFLTSLSLVGLDLNVFAWTPYCEEAGWRHGLRNVRYLKLHLCIPNPKPGILLPLSDTASEADSHAELLTGPARLETLDFGLFVSLPRTINEMPWTYHGFEKKIFDAMLARPSFMQHIRNLSLAEFVFSPNDFIALLSHNTARTLKSLKFHKIHLSEGSWLVFLRQLAVAAELDFFSLSGWISSEHEGWNALSQEEAAAYYGGKASRIHPWNRGNWDSNPDCLVTCEAFEDWNDKIEGLEERWCIRSQIEDWVTSGGGTRRALSNKGDDPTKWAGWSSCYRDSLAPSRPSQCWNDDGFPLMQGYLPACAVHHAPSTERQKQYRYESRWRTRLNRDFSFVWAEELMRPVRLRRRGWRTCPKVGTKTEWDAKTRFCPDVVAEDDFLVDEKMVYEDREKEFVVVNGHFIAQRLEDE